MNADGARGAREETGESSHQKKKKQERITVDAHVTPLWPVGICCQCHSNQTILSEMGPDRWFPVRHKDLVTELVPPPTGGGRSAGARTATANRTGRAAEQFIKCSGGLDPPRPRQKRQTAGASRRSPPAPSARPLGPWPLHLGVWGRACQTRAAARKLRGSVLERPRHHGASARTSGGR